MSSPLPTCLEGDVFQMRLARLDWWSVVASILSGATLTYRRVASCMSRDRVPGDNSRLAIIPNCCEATTSDSTLPLL